MKKYFSNRALGIMYNFIVSNFYHLETWLVPATICFSVPLLLLKLKKKIVFYDFSFSVDKILEKFQSKSKPGLILVDYYGTEIWKTEDLNLLKSYAECIIYDACLSIPAITATQMSADLVLFSTGKSKIVDLGYGAIAFCKPSYKLEVHETVMKTFTNSYYEQLERKWKDALANKKIFLIDNLVFSEWIDCNNNLITSNYERELEVKRREILIHKERINRIYKEIIPKELIAHNLSDIWRFNLFVKNKKILLNSIFEKGLFASSHYANCERVLYGKSDLEGSNFVEKNIVNLFNDFNFNESMAENCGFIIKDLFEKKLIQTVV